MPSYALRVIRTQPMRSAMTIGGISLSILLILFLFSIYRGVSRGSIEYIAGSKADLWVLQTHSTNILRSMSIMPETYTHPVRKVPGVRQVSPMLFLLATISHQERSFLERDSNSVSVYLAGYDLKTGFGAPSKMVEGRLPVTDGEIVLDKALARRLKFQIGENAQINDSLFRVVGICSGTNMFVIQYAFTSLTSVQALTAVPELISAMIIQTDPSVKIDSVKAGILAALPGEVAVFDQSTFLANNRKEMNSGIVPLLYTNAIIGAVVLIAVLTLILVIMILERRRDLAVMKALGAPPGYLGRIVFQLAITITSLSCVVALALILPLLTAINTVSPEITGELWPSDAVFTCLVALAMGSVSAFIAVRRLRTIYPLEVFTISDH
jgi:ABC-type antimicrobial peptide transport system permease subunit